MRFKNCQSCGMPLKRDEKGGGSNADGSLSTVYCSLCFASGQFIEPGLSLQQMQQKVRLKIAEFGIPAFLSGFFTQAIPRLERWKNSVER